MDSQDQDLKMIRGMIIFRITSGSSFKILFFFSYNGSFIK